MNISLKKTQINRKHLKSKKKSLSEHPAVNIFPNQAGGYRRMCPLTLRILANCYGCFQEKHDLLTPGLPSRDAAPTAGRLPLTRANRSSLKDEDSGCSEQHIFLITFYVYLDFLGGKKTRKMSLKLKLK